MKSIIIMGYRIEKSKTGIINPYKIRSWLFVPAVKENLFEKIMTLSGENKPDVIIFDLEDSVHPDFKENARETLRKYLHENRAYKERLLSKYIVSIRINSQETKWFVGDIDLVKKVRPDFLMLSKVESPYHVRFARQKSGVPQLFVVIETIKGFENREEIMKGMEWYDVYTLGYEDLSADFMIDRPSLESLNPVSASLMKSIISGRKNEISMIDAVSRKFGTPENLKEFEKECLFTLNLGLGGKLAIHPSQVTVINSVFDKGRLLERAENILGKFMDLKDGSSVIVGDNKEMMDMPSHRLHSRVLELWNRKASK